MSEEELDGTQELDEEPVEESQETEQAEPEEQPDAPKEDVPDIFSMSDDEYLEYVNKNKQAPKPEPEKKEEAQPEPEDKPDAPKVDYADFYKQVMTPLKSRGRTITPKNLDDIKRLLLMGADYTQKTQALAPMRRIAETVKSANLSDDDLNNLINIHNGDKEAIRRLLKRHKIDPVDFDMDKEDDASYQPKNNIASEQQVVFSEVLERIQPSMQEINDIVKNKWDEKSREQLLRDPSLLYGLHEEIQMGRFDAIQQVLESEKALGRFNGMSDLEAYRKIVTAYLQYEQKKSEKAAKINDGKQQANKAKAAPTKSSPATTKAKRRISDEELLSMSDEDFKRLYGKL